jgi:hypothetical protein
MIRRPADRSLGVAKARQVAAALGLSHPLQGSIDAIAFERGALVVDRPINGARARLVKVSGQALIVVSDKLDGAARRFAISHEIGHHELHAAQGSLDVCTGEDFRKRDTSKEGEANSFAAELLMPRDLVRPLCDVPRPTLAAGRRIAVDFDVSLLAATIRFVELCEEKCAVVVCAKGRVEWAFGSPALERSPRKGEPVQPQSLVYDFFGGRPLRDEPEDVPADAWLDGTSGEVLEHTIAGPAGSTISLIWLRESDEDE